MVALISTLLVALLVLYWGLPLARRQAETEQALIATMVLQQLEVQLDGAEALTLSLARMLAAESSTPARVERGQLLAQMVGNTELYESFYVLDEQSIVQALGVSVRSSASRPNWLGSDLSNLPVVQVARKRQTLSWSDQYLSLIHISEPTRPY